MPTKTPRLKPMDDHSRSGASTPGRGGKSTSTAPTPSPTPSCLYGRPNLLPICTTPSPKKPVAKPAPVSADDMVRALRRDLFLMQSMIDSKTSRSVLNYNQRKLESEVLALQQTSTNAEREVVDLLQMLSTKCVEAGALMSPQQQNAASHTNQQPSVTGPLGSVPKVGRSPSPINATAGPTSVLGHLIDATQKVILSTDANVATILTPPTGGGGGGPSSRDESMSRTPSDRLGRSRTSRGNTPIEQPRGRSADGNRSPSPGGSDIPITVEEDAAACGPWRPVAPVSADSLAALKHVGIAIDVRKDDDVVDADKLIRQLVKAARSINAREAKLEHRLQVNQELSVNRARQVQNEVEMVKSTLNASSKEMDELKKSVTASRFGPNQARALATVKDEPMSFQVEQGYQRELHRSKMRVEELEKKYQDLWDSGIDDRQTVKDLTAEGINLREKIAALEASLIKAFGERDENQALFKGVSQARNEEARMSLVAVKQMENRIEELTAELKKEKHEKETLLENFKVLFHDYNKFERLLLQTKNRQESTVDSFNDYKQLYHTELVSQISALQKELLRVNHISDEQEATLTLQKQQLEDNEVLKNLAKQESTIFLEKIKSSTEWKMVGVRAADEAKQLAMRLVTLNGDKEKKENSMAQQHAERLKLYQTRAAKAIEDRAQALAQEIIPMDPEAVSSDWKERMMRRQTTLEEKSNSKAMERIKHGAKLKSDYAEESCLRIIPFADYYNERFPSDD